MRNPTSTASRTVEQAASANVEGNSRLTAALALVLLIVLAAEGATLLSLQSLLRVHVFLGFALIPLVALKIASTGYRFARYYTGHPEYRRKGPPPAVLRLLGPVVIVTSVVLLGTGVALGLVAWSMRPTVLFWHKASFVVWFGAMTVHVLGHLGESVRIGPRDWWAPATRPSAPARGLAARRWLLACTVVVGALIGIWGLSELGPWVVHA